MSFNNRSRRSAAACALALPEIEGVPLLAPEDRERVGAQLAGLRGRKDAVPMANAIIRAEVFGGADVDGDMIVRAWNLNFRRIGGAR